MTNLKMTAIERLKRQLRQESLRAVIFSHYECTEWELYMALLCAVKLAGRTKEELEYVCLHGHLPGERRGMRLHPEWEVEAREDQTIRRRGLRMIEDVFPGIEPAALVSWLLTVRKFRGKSADELRFIAFMAGIQRASLNWHRLWPVQRTAVQQIAQTAIRAS